VTLTINNFSIRKKGGGAEKDEGGGKERGKGEGGGTILQN